MRLINTQTLDLEEYYGSSIPQYAILSHTWGDDEVTYRHWSDPELRKAHLGYNKIIMACDYALAQGHKHLWVDTNCIDKSSSAELTEAINSMFPWYAESAVCYAYLEDVPNVEFSKSRWWTRGWTLQELLAPDEIVFFDRHWHRIGFKKYLIEEVARITGIRVAFLDESRHLDGACTAEKMSWLSHRVTTRPEDLAYCMLGIFDINMPLLYGEGLKAFIRLQEEIIRNSNDQSIFCWTYNLDVPESWGSVLAPHPSTFSMCQSIRVRPEIPTNSMSNRQLTSYALTNAGLHISLPILPTWSYFLAVLDAHEGDPRNNVNYCVPLIGSLSGGLLERMHWPEKPLLVGSTASKQAERELYIRAKRTRSSPRQQRLSGVGPGTKEPNRASLLLTFKAVDAFRKVETYPTGMFSTATSVLRLDSGARILGGFTRFVRFDNDDVVILFIARRNGHYAPEGEGLNWYCRVMPSSWRFQTADLKEELRSHDEWFGDGTGGVPKSSLGRTSVSLWSIGQGGWNYGQLRLAFIDHSLDDAEDEDMRSDIATVHNDNR